MTVKQNSAETYEALVSIPWDATARFSTASEKAHGTHRARRHIEVMTLPPNTLNYPTSRRCSGCAATATCSRAA